MLTSGTIHVFIIEIQQGIKASKDLSRSLKVVTWLWRTRKGFMYTAFESRKGNLRRAFVISIQPFLFHLISLIPILSFSFLMVHSFNVFICLFFFFFTRLSFSYIVRQTKFFIIFHTRHHSTNSLFSFQNKSFSPTSTMPEA